MVGIVPHSGPQLADGDFINGVANGFNSSFSNGNTAAGNSAVTALQIPSGIYYFEVDTNAGAPAGVTLPFAVVGNAGNAQAAPLGTEIAILNNTSTVLRVYTQTVVNPVTGVADAFSGGAVIATVAANSRLDCACAKNGVWVVR